jgi:hypothetical protein
VISNGKNLAPNTPRPAAVFLFAALGGGFLAAFVMSFLPAKIARAITVEGGVVEFGSALLWLAAAALLFFAAALANPALRKPRLALAILPLAAGMRELDWHKKFTADSILKSNYWLGKIPAPPGEKIIAALILALIIFCVIVAASRYGRGFIADLRKREPIARQTAAALALLFVAKNFLDGINRKLAPLDLKLGRAAAEIAHTWEECLEFTAALLIFGAAFFTLAATRRRKPADTKT